MLVISDTAAPVFCASCATARLWSSRVIAVKRSVRHAVGVAHRDQRVGVGRVADDEDLDVIRRAGGDRLALRLEDAAVGLEQVGALHALLARAGADQQRDVRALERLLGVVVDVDAGEQRERGVEQLERGALGGLDGLRDLQQLQVDGLCQGRAAARRRSGTAARSRSGPAAPVTVTVVAMRRQGYEVRQRDSLSPSHQRVRRRLLPPAVPALRLPRRRPPLVVPDPVPVDRAAAGQLRAGADRSAGSGVHRRGHLGVPVLRLDRAARARARARRPPRRDRGRRHRPVLLRRLHARRSRPETPGEEFRVAPPARP